MVTITCVGIVVADLLGRPIDRFPEKGTLSLVPEMELHVGGGAHNTGVVLAKLGASVRVVAKVGKDGLGEVVANALSRNGVDIQWLSPTDEYHTSATMAMVASDGERTFLHYTGANRALKEEDVPDEAFSDAQCLHLTGTFLLPGIDGEPTARLFRRVREKGVLTSLDTYWDDTGKWLATIDPCLSELDIFISNRDESSRISGKKELVDNARFFLDRGIKVVAIKMGEEGSFIMTNEEKILVPPFAVEAVDGTGAGDAFSAGFLVGYLNNWDLYQVGLFANACGSLCVGKMGATQGVEGYEQVKKFVDMNG